MNFVPRDNAEPLTLAGRFSEEECKEYSTKYQQVCPRIAIALRRPEIPIYYDSWILTEREMDRDPVHHWLGEHGLRYYVAGYIAGTSDHHVFFSLQRSRTGGHVDANEVRLFEQVRGHVRRLSGSEDILTKGDRLCGRRALLEAWADPAE